MQLWIGDTMTEFENSATGLEMLLEAVKKATDASGLLLSHLLSTYENPETPENRGFLFYEPRTTVTLTPHCVQ
jgi:hypothetical protein